jgi:hypothetical protein
MGKPRYFIGSLPTLQFSMFAILFSVSTSTKSHYFTFVIVIF